MNLTQIIEALPPQVYVRRGELVIHFSNPADLVSRIAETSAAIADLDRQADPLRTDGKADRGRRGAGRSVGSTTSRSEAETESPSGNDPD
jgi:hypothetical protein